MPWGEWLKDEKHTYNADTDKLNDFCDHTPSQKNNQTKTHASLELIVHF